MHNPISEFKEWFEQAKGTGMRYPNALALATVSRDGVPAVRMVLMKHFDDDGLVFYTNLESAKSQDIRANGMASACFHWESLGKQIRVTGQVSAVSDAEADAYFATRPRDSQLGAWASLQSQSMPSRAAFEDRFHEFSKLYEGKAVPRPSGWSGWRISPDRVEFWIEKPYRLHDRYVYLRQGSGDWKRELLYP